MKTEYHLVVTSNKYTFKDWMYKFMDSFGVAPSNVYDPVNQQLKVFIGNDTYYYIGFTPQMDTQRLFGYRFKSIINEIGLTEKELAMFNLFVRG